MGKLIESRRSMTNIAMGLARLSSRVPRGTHRNPASIGKLEAVWRSTGQPEVLFDVAVFTSGWAANPRPSTRSSYQELPMALRTQQAEEHVTALVEKRGGASGAAGKPRRVLVPSTPAGDGCVRRCVEPSSCQPQSKGAGWRWCASVQFSCLRGCPGAKVEPGTCLAGKVDRKATCLTDGELARARQSDR
jgi:hypothetical protein